MTASTTITDNPFYKALYNGSGTDAEKADLIVEIFKSTADEKKFLKDYGEFDAYLTVEHAKLESARMAVMQGNPFPAKNEISQTLAKPDDLPADILKQIMDVSQQYARKALELQFVLGKNARQRTVYNILSEVEKKLWWLFPEGKADTTKSAADILEREADSLNLTATPIPFQLEHLQKMTYRATSRLAAQKEKAAQRALNEYLDSGQAFRVKRELPAPEKATFKRRIQPKPL